MKENIFLIGYMGTGKTTVSNHLSGLLGFQEVDIDREIEKRQGMTIREIFEKQGELFFRDMETNMIAEYSGKSHYVAACGGGAVLRPQNAERMKQNGIVILLCAEPDTILERVKNGKGRPLLNGHMDKTYIENMMNQRKAAYDAAADIIIKTDGRTPVSIAEEIKEILNKMNFSFAFL